MQTELDAKLPFEADDSKPLHSPFWRHKLSAQSSPYFEPNPFFFTRKGASLALEGMYRGGHAFLLANGPSLTQLDLAPLHNRWSMTLNNGAKTFRSNANCIVDEPSRFSLSMWLDPTITKFVPMSHLEKPLWDNRLIRSEAGSHQNWQSSDLVLGECPGIVGYRRNERFHALRWLHEPTINWGNNTKLGGGRSVMLPAIRIMFLLGFRTIYLLGVDFEMSESLKYHFDEDRTSQAIRGNMATYTKLRSWFKELCPQFNRAGLKVYNCNPRSKLDVFDFLSFEDALKMSVLHLGDFINERTLGMYTRQTGGTT